MSTDEPPPKAPASRARRAPANKTTDSVVKRAPAQRRAPASPSVKPSRAATGTATKATTTTRARAAKAMKAPATKATATKATATKARQANSTKANATKADWATEATEAPPMVTATASAVTFVPPRPKRVNPSASDTGLGSGGRALLALRAEAATSPMTPQQPGGPGQFGSAPAEKRGGKGPVVAALTAVFVGIGFMVGIVMVVTGSHDKTPTAASAINPAPSDGVAESSSGASGSGGSAGAALAPVPGLTFADAPASVISDLKQGFEDGMKSGLKPGVTVNPDEVLKSVSGKMISRDGEEVALAVAMKFDDQWVAQIGASDFLDGTAAKLGATEHVTVGGIDALYATSDGNGELLTYKDGTFLIVIADASDRATLNEVMAGLIANLG